MQSLSTLVTLSHYARPRADGSLETWPQVVQRVQRMFVSKLAAKGAIELMPQLESACGAVREKRVLPSGRALQFGGDDVDKVNGRLFNCAATFACNTDILYKCLYMLLCGTGVGVSVQKHHVAQLPALRRIADDAQEKVFVVPDTVEGWALSLRVLLASYCVMQADDNGAIDDAAWYGARVVFSYRKIRPKGAAISGLLGKAPGYKPLKTALENVRSLLDRVSSTATARLRPIDVFDLLAHASDAVLSGGVRRSAMIIIFSADDDEMASSKCGDWYIENSQRARANISALVLRKDVTHASVASMLDKARAWGEPGFIFAEDTELCLNPCAEVSLCPVDDDGRVGFELCNLTTINVAACHDEADFIAACEHSALLGTVQACYSDFDDFVGATTTRIVERSRLLGCSLTGVLENPAIGLNEALLRRGIARIKELNDTYSATMGINSAARIGVVKPEGTSSVVLGLSCSGVHAAHAKRYIRRVQVTDDDDIAAFYAKARPRSMEKSSWGKGSNVLSFAVDATPSAVTKQQTTALDQLNNAKLLQSAWVRPGHVAERQPPGFKGVNSVSLTVNVDGDDEWQAVADWLVDNKQHVVGTTFVSGSVDVDYEQAPFERVYSIEELAQEFGDAVAFASALIVDLKRLTERTSLHGALGAVSVTSHDDDQLVVGYVDHAELKRVCDRRRAKLRLTSFATKFFGDNMARAKLCLKRCEGLWHYRCLRNEADANEVDWSQLRVDVSRFTDKQAEKRKHGNCSGGSCSLHST